VKKGPEGPDPACCVGALPQTPLSPDSSPGDAVGVTGKNAKVQRLCMAEARDFCSQAAVCGLFSGGGTEAGT